MHLIARKLSSRRGASVLIALLLFLVCAFVGAAVLTAAYHNASRTSAIRQEQQTYLSVASAAELLKDELVGQSVVWNHVVTGYYTESVDSGGKPTGQYVLTSTSDAWEAECDYTGLLKTISQEVLEVLQGEHTRAGKAHSLSISLPEYPQLETVSGSLTLSATETEAYRITILLSDQNGGNELEVTLNAATGVATQTAGSMEAGAIAVTTKTTVAWNNAVIRLTSIPTEGGLTP